jgi:aconitate hydratase 2/2-methylisocitrate dehydratase
MGKDTSVFLGSAELASICSFLGFIPSASEYHHHLKVLEGNASEIYSLLDFSKNSNMTTL